MLIHPLLLLLHIIPARIVLACESFGANRRNARLKGEAVAQPVQRWALCEALEPFFGTANLLSYAQL